MVDLSALKDLNPYLWIRPLLFMADAEIAHNVTIKLIHKGMFPRFRNDADPAMQISFCGLNFANPIGLAAGFDKHAEVMEEMFGFGFGAVEVGSITPKPQPGNPAPRLFRVPENEAIINRFGFNSDGFAVCRQRLIAYRDHTTHKNQPRVIGVNIGKNKDSVDATADYTSGVKLFAPFADYLTINISSPNTEGLRDLQGEGLRELLKAVVAARNEAQQQPPLFVKIAPDLDEPQMESIAVAALESGIDGMIVGNTTTSRPSILAAHMAKEAGGLSGKPLFDLSTIVLANMYKLTGGQLPLIACGGVSSGTDAYVKIRAGASFVQLYSALIFQGPLLVPRINAGLKAHLHQDGFGSVAEAVGAGIA